jgi:hypothetical protein
MTTTDPLAQNEQFVNYIMARTSYIKRNDDDVVPFVLDQLV